MTTCIVLSAGWAVAIIAIVLFILAINLSERLGPLLAIVAFVLFGGGLISCAIEDRVCDTALRIECK